MGKLKDFKVPTADIPLNKEISITVRGLGLDDLSCLVATHLDSISKAAELYNRSKEDIFATANMQGFILTLAKDFPGLVSEVISIAADEPDAKDVKLPFPIQLRALTEISRLTLEDAGGMGNLFATLGSLWKGARDGAGLSRLTETLSRNSTGESAKMSPS
jgi:hypothetical protein